MGRSRTDVESAGKQSSRGHRIATGLALDIGWATVPALRGRPAAAPDRPVHASARVHGESMSTQQTATTSTAATTAAEQPVIVERRDGVGVVTFNNPARHNAMSLAMWHGAAEAIAGFADSSEERRGGKEWVRKG